MLITPHDGHVAISILAISLSIHILGRVYRHNERLVFSYWFRGDEEVHIIFSVNHNAFVLFGITLAAS